MQHIVRMMWIFRILLEKRSPLLGFQWSCYGDVNLAFLQDVWPSKIFVEEGAKRKCFLAMVRWCGIYSVPARHLGLTRFSEWRGIQMQLKETLRDPKLHRQAITDSQKHPGDVIEIYWNPVSLWCHQSNHLLWGTPFWIGRPGLIESGVESHGVGPWRARKAGRSIATKYPKYQHGFV